MAKIRRVDFSPDCSVYVIGFDANKAPSKVGIASDPAQRMAALQTGHFRKLILGGSWACPDRETARALEAAFHHTQSKSRLIGEWFAVSPVVAMTILTIGLGTMLNVTFGMEPAEVDEVLARARNDHR